MRAGFRKMKRTLFIHVGLPKTGTTAVQTSFAEARSVLHRHGFIYPGTMVDHAVLVARWHQKGPDHFFLVNSKFSRQAALDSADAILDEIRAVAEHGDRHVVVSSEYLHNCNRQSLGRIRAFANDCGLEPRIVCFLRHPVSATNSDAQQSIKQGNLTLAEWIEAPRIRRMKNVLEPFVAEFGRDAMDVHDFSTVVRAGIVPAMLRIIGYDGDANSVESSRVNESLSARAVCIADARNRRKRHDPRFSFDKEFLSTIEGDGFSLPRKTLERVLEKSADDVRYVEKTFGLSLKMPDLPEPAYSLPLSFEAADEELDRLVGEMRRRTGFIGQARARLRRLVRP